jgi:hypothetical protein
MRRTIVTGLLTTLLLTTLASSAIADGRGDHRDRNDDRGDRRGGDRDRRPAAPRRVDRPAIRPDRRAIERRPVFVDNGQLRFGGVSRSYERPVIRDHYYDRRARPRVLTENHGDQPGYIWLAGAWIWTRDEWRWTDGHFIPDPQYATYYDDGSYDYAVKITIGR